MCHYDNQSRSLEERQHHELQLHPGCQQRHLLQKKAWAAAPEGFMAKDVRGKAWRDLRWASDRGLALSGDNQNAHLATLELTKCLRDTSKTPLRLSMDIYIYICGTEY